MEGTLSDSFYETSIFLIPKPEKQDKRKITDQSHLIQM